jgi:hypothetical protein
MPVMEIVPAIVEWIGNVYLRRNDTEDHHVKIAMVAADLGIKDMTDGYAFLSSKTKYFKVDGHMLAVRDSKVGGTPFNKQIAKTLYKQYKDMDYESMDKYQSFQ